MILNITALLFLTALLGDVLPAECLQVIDLTHEQGPSTIYWPGNPEYNFTIISRGLSNGGYWYESNKFQTAEHGGTHVDAPAHFAEGAQRQNEVSIQNLVGPGVIINVTNEAEENPDYRVTVDDVRRWEFRHSRIPDGAVVIMNSGWHKKYPNKTLVFGSQSPDEPSTFHFPGWHEDTANWLLKNRNIHVLGVDTPSTDYGRSTTFRVHVIIGSKNITGAENVANLDAISENGCIIYVSAIKLHDGSGSPARIFATCSQGDMTDSAATCFLNTVLVVFTLLLTYQSI